MVSLCLSTFHELGLLSLFITIHSTLVGGRRSRRRRLFMISWNSFLHCGPKEMQKILCCTRCSVILNVTWMMYFIAWPKCEMRQTLGDSSLSLYKYIAQILIASDFNIRHYIYRVLSCKFRSKEEIGITQIP